MLNFRYLFLFGLLLIALAGLPRVVAAQSTEQGLPSPVQTKEINGRIRALDLGDARLTRHYYAFEGTPGDLLITVDSKNLNGDIDVFTAITFRPLVKTTLYANSQSGEVTKGIYLRTKQILILRVEARTPNDDEGTYHIRFGGTFAPFSGGIPVAENIEAQEETTRPDRGTRLSSTGATLPRPAVETPPAVAEPTPVAATEKPPEEAKTTTPPKTTKPRPGRPATTRRVRPPAKPKPVPVDTEAAKTAKPDEVKTEPEKTESKPATQELPLTGAHLIIESKDGAKIDRPMSTVRRVVVEGGMIVILLKTGKIERVPMSSITRMAIEP